MNFIMAMLAHTYNHFDSKSTGLYLAEILTNRDELFYHESFGAYLSAIPPFNAV